MVYDITEENVTCTEKYYVLLKNVQLSIDRKYS